MFANVWDFLKDPSNQTTLTWIGGGVAAVAAAGWAVIQFNAKKGGDKPSAPSVRADRGSIATGGDINQSPINIDTRDSSKR